MSAYDEVSQALEDFAKTRLKARFVFRSINPQQGVTFGAGGFGVNFGGAGVFVFPLNPQQFEIVRPTLGAVYRTEGGVYEEDWGMGIERFTLRGTFGFRARPAYGSGGIPLVGMDHLLLFQDMITGYYRTAREKKALGEATWEFYDLADMYFFRVRIDAFRMRRVVNEPYLHFYDMQCTVLEDYFSAGGAIPRVALPGGALGPVTPQGILDSVTGALGNLLGAATTAPTEAAGFSGDFGEGFTGIA